MSPHPNPLCSNAKGELNHRAAYSPLEQHIATTALCTSPRHRLLIYLFSLHLVKYIFWSLFWYKTTLRCFNHRILSFDFVYVIFDVTQAWIAAIFFTAPSSQIKLGKLIKVIRFAMVAIKPNWALGESLFPVKTS